MGKLHIFRWVFFIFSTALILGLNLAPTITFINHSPPDRYFPLMHNNSQDFYFYLSLMREGAQGHWLTTIPFTTETHSRSLVFNYFLILGKISSLLGIPMELGYLIARIVSSILFFLCAWLLIRKLKIPYPRLTYLIFLFASPFLKGDTPYLYWWTGIDAIRRASYLPHHMFGGFLLILAFYVILQFVERKISLFRFFSFSLFLLFLMLLIHTPSLLILIMTLPTAIIGYLSRKNISSLRHGRITKLTIQPFNPLTLTSLFLLLSFSLILMLIFAKLMEGDALWKHALEWEKTLQLSFLKEILGGFGILLPFTLIGIIRSILSKNFSYWLVLSWFLVPILMLPLAPFFQISNTRLVQGVPFLPFAMLTAIGIEWIVSVIPTFTLSFEGKAGIQSLMNGSSGPASGMTTKNIILIIIFFIFLLQSIPTLIWSLKDQIHEYSTPYSNIYLDKRLFSAFDFINKEYEPGTVTLASFYTGNYLPAFTNTISFIGHFGYTYDLEKKEEITDNFFSQKLNPEEAKEFLRKNNIRLIFQGPEEKRMTTEPLYPALLRKVFNNDIVTIYQAKT